MSVRRLDSVQPDSFRFTRDNLKWAKRTVANYPKGRQASAVLPLLWRAQEQNNGWTSEPAMRYVAELLEMSYIRVYEIATFYTMFQLSPVGANAHLQVCGTTPCMLRGAEDLIKVCKRKIADNPHDLSPDSKMSWEEVECLGACVNAPMVQIFKDVYEDLTPERLERIIDEFAAGNTPAPGPQVKRQFSAPEGGRTTLLNGKTPRKAASKKKRPAKTRAKTRTKTPAKTPAKAPAAALADKDRPKGLAAARSGGADDLKRISGVGPKIEGILNSLGVFHFDQIAAWNKNERDWVDGYLKFKGRIERDGWLAQAANLAAEAGKD